MKRLGIVGVLLVSVCTATFGVQAQKRIQRRLSRKSSVSKPNNETEATKEARKLVDQFVSKCGDSYYGYLNDQLIEWKGFHLKTTPENLTRADALNGLEYRMEVSVRFEAERNWNFRNGWRDPIDGYCLTLEKRGGVWEANTCLTFLKDVYGGVPPAHKPTCAEVPQ